jgi:hypothetical protein
MGIVPGRGRSRPAPADDSATPPHLTPHPQPGASVLVARNGAILLHKGYGLADLQLEAPEKDETVYHVVGPKLPFTGTTGGGTSPALSAVVSRPFFSASSWGAGAPPSHRSRGLQQPLLSSAGTRPAARSPPSIAASRTVRLPNPGCNGRHQAPAIRARCQGPRSSFDRVAAVWRLRVPATGVAEYESARHRQIESRLHPRRPQMSRSLQRVRDASRTPRSQRRSRRPS